MFFQFLQPGPFVGGPGIGRLPQGDRLGLLFGVDGFFRSDLIGDFDQHRAKFYMNIFVYRQ